MRFPIFRGEMSAHQEKKKKKEKEQRKEFEIRVPFSMISSGKGKGTFDFISFSHHQTWEPFSLKSAEVAASQVNSVKLPWALSSVGSGLHFPGTAYQRLVCL